MFWKLDKNNLLETVLFFGTWPAEFVIAVKASIFSVLLVCKVELKPKLIMYDLLVELKCNIDSFLR
jgi:hypothetical protein